MTSSPHLRITDSDLGKIHQALERHGSSLPDALVDALEAELSRAELVPSEQIPHDVVTMNSRVLFENETTGERREVQLVFPEDVADGRISIFAPVGAALLGLSVGDRLEWPLPSGRSIALRVLAVPYQPEAHGRRASSETPAP